MHTENKENLFWHLNAAAKSGSVPAGMESVHQSLLNKIADGEKRYANRFIDNQEIIKTPSMGLMTITRESLPNPITLFATDLRASHICRLQIYEAHVNKVSGAIGKNALLLEMILSERQFGELMVHTNSGEGFPATMITYDDDRLEEYDENKDPTKLRMSRMMDKVMSSSEQVDGFVDKIKDILTSGQENGKLKKSQVNEIEKYLGMLAGHSVSNGSFAVEQVNEELFKRIEEASLSLHLSTNNLAIEFKDTDV